MPALKNLTAAFWKSYKKRAGIEDKPWVGSHASVGSAITKLNSRRASWQRSRTDLNLRGYFRALEVLKKQMDKFLMAKEFKTEVAAAFRSEILKWKSEIDFKLRKLAAEYSTNSAGLAKANQQELGQVFDTFVL